MANVLARSTTISIQRADLAHHGREDQTQHVRDQCLAQADDRHLRAAAPPPIKTLAINAKKNNASGRPP
jgi:hypothetical protein